MIRSSNKLLRYVPIGLLVTLASALYGHPLGNFTVNHFSHINISEGQVRIRFIIDLAEIPAFGELRSADTDGNGKTSYSELTAYGERVAPSYVRGLLLSVDGKPQQLTLQSANVTTLPGAGGLLTLRLQLNLLTPLNNIGSGFSHELQFRDTNGEDRIGWHEIVVLQGAGISVYNSSAFANSVSDELRRYPPDMLASPLDERKATLLWIVGPAPAGAKALRTRDGRPTGTSRDRLAELITVEHLTPGIALLGLLVAALLGGVHALSPGHGKTVVGSYLVGSRGTAKHAVFLGATVTITHTAGVFALGFLTLFASRYVLPERLFPVLSFTSGALVAWVGLRLFFRRIGTALTGIDEHSHEHVSEAQYHVHSHGGRPHSHSPPVTNGDAITWRSLLALGISGGLLPCPSALVVLLSAVALHRIGYGLLLVLAFSIGLASALTAIGLIFVHAGRWFNRVGSAPRLAVLSRVLPVCSALVVACLGVTICYGALSQAGFAPVAALHQASETLQSTLSGQRPLASMGALAVLTFGLVLGFKHATEADHVIAVSSIVTEHRQLVKVGLVGALWGVGHTITLVFVGLIVLVLGIAIPEHISQYLEFGVGLMIIGLSGTALARVLRGSPDIHIHKHNHGSSTHSHLHFHEEDTEHDLSLEAHSHSIAQVGLKPLLVGAMHGLAGSAALTLLVLTQVRSLWLGLSYLLLFGMGSIFGMITVSMIIGMPFALSASRLTKFALSLQLAAGAVGVCFGCWYAYSTGLAAWSGHFG